MIICKLIVAFFFMFVPVAALADDTATNNSTESTVVSEEKLAQQRSVAKLKESVAKTQGNIKIPGGITEISTSEVETGPNAVTMIKGLAFCLGVFFIGIAIFQKLGKKNGFIGDSRSLRLVERLQVTNKTALVLVEYEGKKILMSVGAENVSFVPESEQKQKFDDVLEETESLSV